MNCKVKRGFIIALLLTFTATLFMFLSIARTSDKGFADGYVAQEFTATTNYDFSIEDGVSIKISKFENDVQNAMRFVTKLKTTDFQEGYKIVTLITLTEYLEDAGLNNSKFTLDNLDGLGVKYTKVTFSADNQNVTSQEKDGYYVYNACIYNIKDANYTKEFCARSYVTDANGNVTQYTETYADAVLWDVANAHKDNADDVQGDSIYGPNADMTEKAYVSTLCKTYDVTINNATGTPYVKTVKHGETLSKHINTELGKKVVKIENFLYPSAYVDGEGKDCSNDIITTDINLTAEYDPDGVGAILIDGTTVTGVGSQFFNYTTEVDIPDDLSIDEIGVGAFAETKLTMIKMPESVTKIGREAFFGCKNLETVIMPGVTYIGVNEGGEGVYRHFMNCYALKSVVVGETFELELVTDRGTGENRCFYVEGTDAVPNQVSIYLTSSDGTATLHAEGATSRVQNMLSGDRVYNLNETEKDICGTWSWDGDEPKLSEYATHENQDGICSRCGLETTAGLTYTKYTDKEEYYVSSYTGSATEVYVRATYDELPVTAIGKSAFDGKTNITKVVLPKSVTTIGGFAFQNCTALGTVIMPGVTSITTSSEEYYQFYQCNSLTTIVVGESFTVSYGATGMAGRIFYTEDTSCIGKTKVYISSSGGVMTVASNSSYNRLINSTPYHLNETENDICGMWRMVDGVPTLSENTSHNYVDGVCANCGEEKYTAGLLFTKYGDKEEYYVSAYNGSDTEVLVPSKYLGLSVVAIGIEAFYGNTNIIKIVMPESVTTIHGKAFYGCTNLQTVIMPGVTTITTIASANSVFGKVEHSQFLDCNSLTVVVAGSSLSVLAGAGTSGGDQRVFFTSNSDRYTKTKIYLTSTDGVIDAYSASASGSARNNMIDLTPYHLSETRPTDEAKLATTWNYYNGVPTLWKDIPVAE